MAELTAAQLRQMIKRIPKAKAPGADGWRYQDLRDWPLPMVDMLAKFYALVEKAGRWPASFNLALVAMLHKMGRMSLMITVLLSFGVPFTDSGPALGLG